MVKKNFVAKCPRCGTETGTETETKNNIRWRFSVDGVCPNCKIHFTTSMFWEFIKD